MIVLLQLAVALGAAPVQAPTQAETVVPAVAVERGALAPTVLPYGAMAMPVGVTRVADSDTVPKSKKKAVQLSEGYETRLRIHQLASYATLPLFAAQIVVGQTLYDADTKGTARPDWAKSAHAPLAYALGGLFAVNTVTGVMNWWETRNQDEGRSWRTVHAALMLAADAGFAYTGSLGSCAVRPGVGNCSATDRNTHRNFALGSSVLALGSYVMMLSPFRKD